MLRRAVFFESYDELNEVTEKLTPEISKRVAAKGLPAQLGPWRMDAAVHQEAHHDRRGPEEGEALHIGGE
jgi:hypothetical protein